MIVAGRVDEAIRASGDWVFVDIGFSSKSKSCCIAVGDADPFHISYGELGPFLVRLTTRETDAVNLVIEAPLSVTFSMDGNPTGRQIEMRRRIDTCRRETRYWYVGPGAVVLTAATYLLFQLKQANQENQIRLFEGFASFKSNPPPSSHVDDICALRDVVWGRDSRGRIVGPDELKLNCDDVLRSAFEVAGMDFGIPAVVLVEEKAIDGRSEQYRDSDCHGAMA